MQPSRPLPTEARILLQLPWHGMSDLLTALCTMDEAVNAPPAYFLHLSLQLAVVDLGEVNHARFV